LTPQRVGSSFDGFPLLRQTGIQGARTGLAYESPVPVHLQMSSSVGIPFALCCEY